VDTGAGGDQLERRIVSVLFADLVGFTTLSEHLDPEDVATVQEAYFGAVRETIGRYGGLLEKFIGDAAMAVFGVPKARDDDAERAVRAGLALASAVEQLSVKVGLSETDLRLRVGVNTGEVLHSRIDESDWRVTGDAVNVAARFQSAAPPGGVLVGETTALAAEQSVELERVGTLELKGKAEPVRAWLATGVRSTPSREHAMGGLRAPILGRDEELALLARALARTAEGGAERVVIVAPPGVGKSRLLEESTKAAEARGALIWRARLRPDLLAPFEPIAQLFASALAGIGKVDVSLDRNVVEEALGKALSSAGTHATRREVVIEEVLTALFPAADGDPGQARVEAGLREQRFAAWLEALDALSGDSPSVWMLEDVHWAGGDLLAFLRLAGGAPSRKGRLVLASSRPSLLERASDWCVEDPEGGTRLLNLPALSAPHAEDLIRALVGDALPPELVLTVAERSDGNPLFIEELLRTWISAGTLVRAEDEGWRLVAPASDVPVPTTVHSIYAAQLDDLPGHARTAARRASVAGRRFPLASLDPLGVPDRDAAVAVLHRRALVGGPVVDPLLGSSYIFRHALLRDAGYASLARAERALLHVRLARWLEQAAGEHPGEVAEVIGNHYRAALESVPRLSPDVGDGVTRDAAAELAAKWFERAAEAAVEVAAHDAARSLLRQALDFTPQTSPLDRARRCQRLGDATAYVEDMNEGAIAYEQAVHLFGHVLDDQMPSPSDRRTARSGYANAVLSLGLARIQQLRFNEAAALADAALNRIGEADDVETGWLLYLRAWGTTAFAYRPEVKEDLERATRIALDEGDRRLELEVRSQLVSVWADEGQVSRPQLAEEDERMTELAMELGEWQKASRSLRYQALMNLDDHASEAKIPLARAADLAQAHGLIEEMAWIDYMGTEIGLVIGDWNAALAAGVRALDMADRGAYHRVQVRTWFALSPIAFARGQRSLLDRAQRWFREHEDIFPHSPFGNVMHAALDVRLASMSMEPFEPNPEELLPAWDESQSMPSWHAAVESLYDAWLASNRLDAARKVLDRISAWREHPITSTLSRGVEDLLRSRLTLAEGGSISQIEAAGRRGLDAFRTSGAPWWIAKAIRSLERVGAASSEELEEASGIERTLKHVGPPA
jgi:class 3 adenylate cyclase/tetratricopeptide (TPR) repeat protein